MRSFSDGFGFSSIMKVSAQGIYRHKKTVTKNATENLDERGGHGFPAVLP